MRFDNYRIRLIEENDRSAYFQLVSENTKRLEDFFAGTVSKTKTLEDTGNFISEVTKKISDRLYFPYVVIDNENQKIIGFIDVKNIDWNIPKAELGCFIDEKYAGKGISKKGLLLVIEHITREYGFIKLFLRTHQSNASARSLAEKCGFEMEGTIRKDYKTTKGEIVDLVYYGLVK